MHPQPTGDDPPGLFAGFPERASQCSQLQIVHRAGIFVVDHDDDGALASEKMLHPSVLRPNETVCLRARLRMDYLLSESK